MRHGQVSMPYALPPEDVVDPGPWMTVDGLTLPARLPDWDPATDLHLFREIEIRHEELTESCDLSPRCELALVPTVRSNLTGLRIVGDAGTLGPGSEGGTVRVAISLHVRGESLGGAIALTTDLVWVAGQAGPLGPRRPGSRLWTDEIQCVIEGAAARFPISAVAFSALPTLDPNAAWTLDWDPTRMDDPVLGAVRLLVNTEHERLRESIISGSEDPGADVVRAVVQFDIARTLIGTALEDEEFVAGVDSYPEGSVGRTIRDLLEMHWDESAAVLAARMRNYPRRFEMELQSRFRPIPESP